MRSFFTRLSIRQRLATVPIVFAVSTLCLLGFNHFQTSEFEVTSANLINIAGRQRMLNQRLTRELLQTSNGEVVDYKSTLKLLRDSLALLMSGGEHEFGLLAAARDERLIELLKLQETLLDEKDELANTILASVDKSDDSRALAIQKLIEQTAAFQSVAHDAVMRQTELAAEARSSALIRSIASAAILIFVGCSWSIVCSSSVAREVNGSATEVHRLSSGSLPAAGHRLRENARDTSGDAIRARAAAEEVSKLAQSLGMAIDEFEISIIEVSSSSSAAAHVAREAVDAIDNASDMVNRLGNDSREIGAVIRSINAIADQTNMLALNATIEASRAGEKGRGFSIVAQEVKELASKTTKATNSIGKLVKSIRENAVSAVDAIQSVSQTILEISESQQSIATAANAQTELTSKISSSINEVANESDEIAQSVSCVAKVAETTTECSTEAITSANEISGEATKLINLARVGS